MKKLFFSAIFCFISCSLVSAASLEVDFRKSESLRLFNGAELKDGLLIVKGRRSYAEVVGSEKIKFSKKGLTVSCVAAFDKRPQWGQDLFWKE